jgi:hypothetical protein
MARTLTDHLGELQNAAADAYSAAMVVACPTEAHLIFANDPDLIPKVTQLVHDGGVPYGFVIGWYSEEEGDDDILIANRTFDAYRADPKVEKYMDAMMTHFKSMLTGNSGANPA